MSEGNRPNISENQKRAVGRSGTIVKQLSAHECRRILEQLSGRMVSGKEAEPDSWNERCLVILDVRTPREFLSGHLNGAINLDFRSPSFRDQISSLDRHANYLLYCRTGVRSGRAIELMVSLGFSELYNLTKGIEEWLKEGFEVKK